MMRVGDMFAGIGGMTLAMEGAGAEAVWANEIDRDACKTYRENFGPGRLEEGDIRDIDTLTIPDIDILTAGFPCQPFSVAGHRKGFDDERGTLFYEVMRIIRAKKPRAVLLENVKNLLYHDDGRSLDTILDSIRALGYVPALALLNTARHGGIPQNRERVYIVAFASDEDMKNFVFPEVVPLTMSVADIIVKSNRENESFYYSEDWPHYAALKESMDDVDAVYQWRRTYVRKNKCNVCPTLTASMGTGGHNVPIVIDDYGIRKLTPEECLAFQGFPKWFKFGHICKSSMYKQAGNSVSVPVVQRIAESMISAMERTESSDTGGRL